MSQEGSKLIFWVNDFKARFIKLQVVAKNPTVDEDAQYNRSNIQISKFEFIDDNGTRFVWPSNTTITKSSWLLVYDPIENMLDDTFSKMCVDCKRQLPFEITLDLGEVVFDFKQWCFYRWWTAGDTAKFPSRNMMDWKLLASSDGERWVYVDEVSGYNAPTQNNVLAYTSRRLEA